MKNLLFIWLLLLTLPVFGQLDNSVFDQPARVSRQDSGRFSIALNTLGFVKNNEYFNKIADGYTLFGYQVNPSVAYQPLPSVKLTLGIYVQKDFGANGYQTIMPTYSFKYVKGQTTLIFGTLEGSTAHRLVEPLYDFEEVLIDRLENGLQVKVEKRHLWLDGWVDWQNMIYKGDADQEQITGGIAMDYKIIGNQNIGLSIPIQVVVHHQGGQIDNNPNPLKTLWNSAIGIRLAYEGAKGGFIEGLDFQPYYVYYKDFSFDKRNTFEDGSGLYLNLTVKTKWSLDVMASYWKGHEFESFMGGQLYPSVSHTYKNPFYVEQDRELFILRLMHTLRLADNLTLTTRFEPFYDVAQQSIEFSHGFYINYNTDFSIKKKR